jgi:hypothetical protein
MKISSALLAIIALLGGQILLGAAAMTLTTGTALAVANNPLIVWQGGVTVTSASTVCADAADGLKIGKFASSMFRPRLDPAEPASAITMLFNRAAVIFARTSGGGDQMHGNGNYIGSGMSDRAEGAGGSFTGTYSFTINPSAITAATTSVIIAGTINDFAGIASCTVKFRASYQRRPN